MNDPKPTSPVSWSAAIRTFLKIAIHSFGGPAGQIAVMHRVLVEEKKWISESRFLHALNYCMLLPGPEATQLITYVGWLMHRTLGGIVAGALFVLPGFVSILALSILYAGYRDTTLVAAVFYGIKPAVLAIVVEALLRIGRRALKTRAMVLTAVAAFIAIFFFAVPFPIIILSAGLLGLLIARPSTATSLANDDDGDTDDSKQFIIDAALRDGRLTHVHPTAAGSVRNGVIWLTLWSLPFVLLAALGMTESLFFKQAGFFSKMAVVTFGGAYSVLTYVAQQAVDVYGWLKPGQMLDGLGLAETTPGPLIQVVQFVGFMGAYQNPGTLHPVTAGVISSLVVVWVTYIPCFLWIFVGAPYMEALRRNPHLRASLTAITAAVVGVILNLAVWFSIHTLFAPVETRRVYGMNLLIPEWAKLDLPGLLIAIASAVVLLRFKWGMLRTLAAAALIGLLHHRLR